MKLGNNLRFLLIFIFTALSNPSSAENEIVSSPLLNLDQLKPSYEDLENDSENSSDIKIIQNKKK